MKTAAGGAAWAAQDCTPILAALKSTDPLPYVAIAGDTPEIRTFVHALRDRRRGLWQYSSWGSAPLAYVDGTSVSTGFKVGLRLDRPYPAITHCSTDSVKHPTIEHSSRARWDGTSIVDKADRYEVTLYAEGWYPTKSMTAKVTLRRLGAFAVGPGAEYTWEILAPDGKKSLQSGRAVAGDDGLLTIEGCNLANERRRLIVRPLKRSGGTP